MVVCVVTVQGVFDCSEPAFEMMRAVQYDRRTRVPGLCNLHAQENISARAEFLSSPLTTGLEIYVQL